MQSVLKSGTIGAHWAALRLCFPPRHRGPPHSRPFPKEGGRTCGGSVGQHEGAHGEASIAPSQAGPLHREGLKDLEALGFEECQQDQSS